MAIIVVLTCAASTNCGPRLCECCRLRRLCPRQCCSLQSAYRLGQSSNPTLLVEAALRTLPVFAAMFMPAHKGLLLALLALVSGALPSYQLWPWVVYWTLMQEISLSQERLPGHQELGFRSRLCIGVNMIAVERLACRMPRCDPMQIRGRVQGRQLNEI